MQTRVRVRLPNGVEIAGASKYEVVKRMAKRAGKQTIREYMDVVTANCCMRYHDYIKWSTVEEFLDELIHRGIVIDISDCAANKEGSACPVE